MNILVLSWRDPKHPLSGGAEQVMHEHMRGWIAGGHTVVLFSSYFKGAKRTEILDGVEIIRRGPQLLGVQMEAFFWYLFGNHPKFNLVIDQFHGIPFFTPLYMKGKKLAVIQEVTKKVWFLNDLPKPINWFVAFTGYISEPFVFLLYKNIPFMTGSNSAREDLVKIGIPEKNVTIIPHGIILSLPKIWPKKEKKFTVTYLGALAKDKGIEDAIRMFSILRKGDFNFWVVGKAGRGYDKYLFSLAKSLEVYEKIKFWGFVSQSEKFELLAKSHLLINPSIREGWGLVNIEANSVGTSVVGYKSQGLVDSIKNNVSGILCEENTPESLAKNVLKILSNKRKYNEIRRSAIKWSKNFSWEKSKKMSLDLIEELAL